MGGFFRRLFRWFGLPSESDSYTREQFDRAKMLVDSARVFSVSTFTTVLDLYPEMRAVSDSNLLDFWDYLITVASVGTAFMAIIDDLPERDRKGMPYAIQSAINSWRAGAYETMVDFLEYVNRLSKSNVKINHAVGGWIWANLEKHPKSGSTLKNLAASLKLVPITGGPILQTFYPWWHQSNLKITEG